MSKPYRTTRRIEFRDTDAAGIAHFTAFFAYMEEVEHEFLRSLGLSVMNHDREGMISWPRVSARCDYRGAAKFEDILDVELRVQRLGERSVTFAFTFFHAGRAVADGQVTSVCCRLSPEGPPQSIRVPDSVVEKLKEFAPAREV